MTFEILVRTQLGPVQILQTFFVLVIFKRLADFLSVVQVGGCVSYTISGRRHLEATMAAASVAPIISSSTQKALFVRPLFVANQI